MLYCFTVAGIYEYDPIYFRPKLYRFFNISLKVGVKSSNLLKNVRND